MSINIFDPRCSRRRSQRTMLFDLTQQRHYVNAPRTWIPGELVTASMMNGIRDLFLEIEAGTAEHMKAWFEGRTSAALSSDLSAAGAATVAYDTTLDSLVMSLNGSAYEKLGAGDISTIVFHPAHNNPPGTAYAVPNVRNSHPVLDFATGSDLSAIFSDIFWPDYDGEDVAVDIIWVAATATSGTNRFDVAFERVGTALDIDADSFATAQSVTSAAANGTSGIAVKTTVTFTSAQIDGLVAGEKFRLKVTRDDGHAGNTMAGTLQILNVVLRKI